MEKYIVYDIDNHDLWSNVLLKNRHGFIERHVFMSDFINGNKTKKGVIAPRVAGAVNVGDKMYSLGRSQPFVLPAVWVCRGRLSFCIQPVSDYAIKEFVYKYFDAEEALRLDYKLDVLDLAIQKNALGRALECEIPQEVYEQIKNIILHE